MATFSKKGWNSDSGGFNMSLDEYVRYMDNIDYAVDRSSRPQKTIHEHKSFKEKVEPDTSTGSRIPWLLSEAHMGNTVAKFMLGQEYAKCGNLREAEHWLKKVADLGGWPEAEKELSRVRELIRCRLVADVAFKARDDGQNDEKVDVRIMTSESFLPENPLVCLPRINAFRICEFELGNGEKRYLVVIRKRKDSTIMEPMGYVLRGLGYDIAKDLFETEAEAQKFGLLAMRTWGRQISLERERKWNLQDGINDFLSCVLKHGVTNSLTN